MENLDVIKDKNHSFKHKINILSIEVDTGSMNCKQREISVPAAKIISRVYLKSCLKS